MENAVPRRLLIAVSSAAVLGLSACSQSTPADSGNATPAATEAQAPQEDQAQSPQEKIDSPLNLKAVTDTCQLLTPEQLEQLGGGGEPEPAEQPWPEMACSWEGDNLGIELSPDSTNGGGIERIKNNFAGEYDEVINVAGYPAIHIDVTDMTCTLSAAVSEEHVIGVGVAIYNKVEPQHQDPCAFADRVFTEVVKNIPPES